MSAPQFSLRRLLINVTVLCIVMCLIGIFPDEAIWLALKIALHLPAILVAVVACFFSAHKYRTFAIVALGALAGWLVPPQMLANWGRAPTVWERFTVDFMTVGIAGGVGAFLGTIVDLAIVRYRGDPPKQALRNSPDNDLEPVQTPDGWD